MRFPKKAIESRLERVNSLSLEEKKEECKKAIGIAIKRDNKICGVDTTEKIILKLLKEYGFSSEDEINGGLRK